VADLARGLLPGLEPVASVTVVDDGRPATVAAGGPLALDLDRVQYRERSGPCLTAAVEGAVSVVADPAAAARWPVFAEQARQRSCAALVSTPLPAREQVAAALNLYAGGPGPAPAQALGHAARLAGQAAVTVANVYLYERTVQQYVTLQAALASRGAIDQAKGILMERFKVTADQAFGVLAQVSMVTNRKVRDIAVEFIETGRLPGR
jgi:GAF domain-containing protein